MSPLYIEATENFSFSCIRVGGSAPDSSDQLGHNLPPPLPGFPFLSHDQLKFIAAIN
jgi:hypothetical protein